MDNEQFLVAWILSSSDHHKIATSVFDETYYHTLRSASSNAIYTTGRIGQHRIVVASKSSVDVSLDNEDFVNNLLREFPAVRAGFLVSTDAEASQTGRAAVGDIVFGTKPDLQSGTIYLDAEQTKRHERLFISGQAKRIPESATLALEDILGHKQHGKWPQYLGEDYPLHHRTFRGAIASSREHFGDPSVLDRIGSEHDILCFEMAAASMSSYSFILVAGIARRSDNQHYCLPSAQICNAVVWYLSGLVRLISPAKLVMEPPLVNYFQYEPFDLDRPGFRLVRLEAGSNRDPIRCHLFQAYLDDEETLIPYEALSYCWGDDTSLRQTVLVNGSFLFITENLFEALIYLREPGEDRILWIDALCIDQSNVRERGHQVSWMGKVYQHAERVLFWLGHVPYNFRDLMESLKLFKNKVPRHAWESWALNDSRWSDIWIRLQTQHLPRLDEVDLQEKLKSMMSNEWFSRVWVLQEVANARKALLGCSEGWVDAMAFATATRILDVETNTQCQAVIDVMPGPSRRASWWAQKSNICTLLWRFRESQASDPRDRLYALLGLASDMKTGDERISADYTKTEDAVLRNIATYLFNDNAHKLGVKSLSDLQMRIQNLAAITLESMVFLGSSVEDLHRYMQRQNPTVWLSEAVVNHAWFRRSDHFDIFRNSPAFHQVVLGQIPSATSPEQFTTLDLFLQRHHGRIIPTKETIEALNQSGLDMVVEVLRNNRQDVKITKTFALEAARKGPFILQALLDKYGPKVRTTEALVIAALKNGPKTAQVLFNQRGYEIDLTETIVDVAAERGHTTFQFLLEMCISRNEVPEALVEQTARMGPDTLRLLLDRCGSKVKITQDLLRVTRHKDIDLVRMVLEQHDNKTMIKRALVEEAARMGPDTLRLLLNKRGSEVEITMSLVEITRRKAIDLVRMVLEQHDNKIMVTRALVEEAARMGPDTLQLLLDRRGSEVMITGYVTGVAARQGANSLRLLLDRRSSEVKITESVTIAATHDPDSLRLLLDRRNNEISITSGVIGAAVRSGPETLQLLLDRRNEEINITSDIIEDAILSNPQTLRLLLDRRNQEVYITSNMIRLAIDSEFEALQLLLDRGNEEVNITSDMIKAAIWGRPGTLQLLLERCNEKINITSDEIEAVIWSRPNILPLLLERCNEVSEITSDVITAAIRSGPETLQLVLDWRGNEVKITDSMFQLAVSNAPNTLRLLLDRCGDELKITEALMEEAASKGPETLQVLIDCPGYKSMMNTQASS
ncbi:hypothetical protein CSUB01_11672 [Colletotrichum sublineola]|uniref:Heterokaryon incompatibility domain-containing protein n=1 Tax=Colletotrichum sublineola TaxID=1173701 RepID=A0A066XDZ7_COLSU|nr:hypothetical protein CSUB01_11672 [Colletotrichum sublineola]